MKKRFLAGIMAATMVLGLAIVDAPASVAAASDSNEVEEITLDKSTGGNPIAGFDQDGNILYAGDPSILIDGDTAYLYVGHDSSTGNGYNMLEWCVYSSQDLKNWTYENVFLKMSDITWATADSAWAAQTLKYNGKYYFFYCSQGQTTNNKEIAVAVSDTPTGPFKDLGPVVYGSQTNLVNLGFDSSYKTFQWEDIDPTFWVDTDENGKETVYLCWGNTNPYMCEVSITDDGVSVVDRDGDGEITLSAKDDASGDADIWHVNAGITGKNSAGGNNTYTEAPWLYRRQDADGNYYGQYYLFYAMNWREEMAYSTTDSLDNPNWTFGGRVMDPSSTSNTNHMAVFDFKGHTYFVYHNGMLPWGSGYRRVACIEEIEFNEDGSLDYIQQTSTGLTGTSCEIYSENGNALAHENYENSLSDSDYPYLDVELMAEKTMDTLKNETALANDPLKNYVYDAMWEIEEGKADTDNEAYVSIQSYDKPGLYLAVNSDYSVTLAQDYQQANTVTGITADSERMTFRTIKGLNGKDGYTTFESVKYPGYYLAVNTDGSICVTKDTTAAVSFNVSYNYEADLTGITASLSKTTYAVGDAIDLDNLRVKATYDDGTAVKVASSFYTTDAASIDMSVAGTKKLTVTYVSDGVTYTATVDFKVCDYKSYTSKTDAQDTSSTVKKTETAAETTGDTISDLPEVGKQVTVGKLNFEVTSVDGANTSGYNGTVKVTGLAKSTSSVVIPNEIEIDGYTFAVNEIAAKAFSGQKKIKTIKLGNNITKIGSKAISGINKKATIKVAKKNYKAVKKLLKSSTGYKKTMKIKKV